jgi:hypothetical protein
MRLFCPSARATNWLLIVFFVAIGYAFYMRYLVVEQSSVSLACQSGLASWTCTARRVVTELFGYSVFGWAALTVSALNLIRPSLVLFAVALAAVAMGVVLYNVGLAAFAAGLLLLSLARRASATA